MVMITRTFKITVTAEEVSDSFTWELSIGNNGIVADGASLTTLLRGLEDEARALHEDAWTQEKGDD